MNKKKTSWHFLLLLILVGESIFILPFILSRVFRPTVLEVFNLDNIQLGLCFSVYGIVALVSYLLGGPLADKFPPRKLIATAMWMTALGGLVYASFPSYAVLQVLYGYWGFTTIFLFWSPMIKATRIWGGDTSQGKAFSFLDGGRGAVGALFAAMGIFIFSLFITSGTSEITIVESEAAFRQVILVSSGIVAFIGVLVWFFMNLNSSTEKKTTYSRIKIKQVKEIMRLPSIWLLMIIILCAYVGYKITDIFSLYANDVMLYDQVQSAKAGTFLLFIRSIVGILIGVFISRSQSTLWLAIGFVILLLGALIFAFGFISNLAPLYFFISILIVAIGVYAARSLYFAIMEEGQIPLALTGTAVGLVSLIGYTPDIFVGPIMGYLLEASPGIIGHQHVFWMLAIFSFVGSIASWYYFYLYGRKNNSSFR